MKPLGLSKPKLSAPNYAFTLALTILRILSRWRTIEAVRSGAVAWFDAAVLILDKASGAVIGRDSLGCCAYRDVEEFYTSHRDRDPMNRNSSIMRAARGDNVVICHHFPGMVAEATREARANARRVCGAVRH